MKKILIVDDDPGFIAFLQKKIQSAGFSVLIAHDGIGGLASMRAVQPDLVILDVMMPAMDGYSFLSEIRSDEQLRNIPLIVITGKAELEDFFRMQGVSGFFSKPVNVDDIILKVRGLIGG